MTKKLPPETGPLELTTDQLLGHVRFLMEGLRNQLEMAATGVRSNPAKAGWVICIFHGADARAVRLYRRLDPRPIELPPNGALVMVAPLKRLAKEARRVGYKEISKKSSFPEGDLRLYVFTLGVVVVQMIDVVTMSPGGTA